jgi:nitrile hydratase
MTGAALAPGTRVRVRLDWPETRGPCHIRTPHYLRGREGVIHRALGHFPNPEKLAFARPAETLALYHVRFDLRAIWPEADADLLVELYDSWLETGLDTGLEAA